jgi:hypothetical protein
MATELERPTEERIMQVLQHLGIAPAHIAARVPGDWLGMATKHPEAVVSLTHGCW